MLSVCIFFNDGENFYDYFNTLLPCLPNVGDIINTDCIDDENHPAYEFDEMYVEKIGFHPPTSKIDVFCKTRYTSKRRSV